MRFARVQTVLVTLLLFGLTPVRADHGAPAPQLGDVTLCLKPSSVQFETEGVTLSQKATRSVRNEVLNALQMQLEAHPYKSDCDNAKNYTLISLYVRFLDPRTYVGFPKNSYTCVTTAQVGSFVGSANAETVLPERVYSASASDIFQAAHRKNSSNASSGSEKPKGPR